MAIISGSTMSIRNSSAADCLQRHPIDELFQLIGNASKVCDGDLDLVDDSGDTMSVDIRLSLTDMVKLSVETIFHTETSLGDQLRQM